MDGMKPREGRSFWQSHPVTKRVGPRLSNATFLPASVSPACRSRCWAPSAALSSAASRLPSVPGAMLLRTPVGSVLAVSAVWVSAFCVPHSFPCGVPPSRYLPVCVCVCVFTLGSQSPLWPLALWAFAASLRLSHCPFLSRCWTVYETFRFIEKL